MMNKGHIFAASLWVLLGYVPSSSAQVAAAATAGAVSAAPHLAAAVPAVMMGTLSSASAHVGAAVLAKLTSSAALSNGLKLPVGSQMIGHVTEAKSFGGGNKISSLAMIFDKVRLPNGQEQPLSGEILQSIGTGKSQKGDRNQPLPPSSQSRSSDGGLLGGVTSGLGSAVTGIVSTTGQVLGVVTGLPGVLLGADGTLSAQNREVEVPAGAQINIQASAEAR